MKPANQLRTIPDHTELTRLPSHQIHNINRERETHTTKQSNSETDTFR